MNEHDFFNRFVYDPEKDLLGSGGFGTVYRAYDHTEKRYVAIKISQVKDIYGKFTLLNEVELSKNIDDHTNVARYDLGLRAKIPFPVDYAVMTYYEDGNLEMVLRKQNGIFSPQDQYDILSGLLEGIAHLHTENVIHRDLKLANILMHRTKQGQWRPKIADFGLSRQLDSFDSSFDNSAIGITISYAAPEQIENKPIRRNVDLWAFGVIAYRILTGEMPFDVVLGNGATSASVEISRKIVQCELPDKLATIPEPYQTMIRRCWVKDTSARAQSANELLALFSKKDPPSLSSSQRAQVVELSVLANSNAPKKQFAAPKQDAEEEQTIKKSKSPLYIGVGVMAVLILGLYWTFSGGTPSARPKTKADSEESVFQSALQTHTLSSYKTFLQSFPNSKFKMAATDSLTNLEKKYNNLVNDAMIFLSDKEFAIAKAYLNQALEINPNDAEIKKQLAKIQ